MLVVEHLTIQYVQSHVYDTRFSLCLCHPTLIIVCGASWQHHSVLLIILGGIYSLPPTQQNSYTRAALLIVQYIQTKLKRQIKIEA